jgi:adenosylcobinamide-phosphate synthase
MMALAWTLPVLAAALLLDRLVGDPEWLWRRVPHPVVLIGQAIDRFEAQLNVPDAPFSTRRRRGALAIFVLVLAGGAAAGLVESGFATMPFGFAAEAVLIAILLAQRSLVDHVSAVLDALTTGGLAPARTAVARIVGRDVSALDEAAVARATIESAAENFSDGVVAPALCYALFGLPGLIVFKIVNTADSMIGYRSPRYEAFGWAAARLDDVLNFIPARVSAVLIAAAAATAGGNPREAIACALRDAKLHKSPNAGWPEAATAGALGLAFGGPRRYGDAAIEGAWLNPSGRREACPADIRAAVGLIDSAWGLLLTATIFGAFTALWTGR